MKGLLSSRLLKEHSGVKRLSKSLYRSSKLRKTSKRPGKLLLHSNPSLFEEEEQEEAAEEDDLGDDEHDEQENLMGSLVGIEAAFNKFTSTNSDTDDCNCNIEHDADDDHDDDATDSNADRKEEEDGDSDDFDSDNDADEMDEDDDDKESNGVRIVEINSSIESSQQEPEDDKDNACDDSDSDNDENEDDEMQEDEDDGDGDYKESNDVTIVKIKGSLGSSQEEDPKDGNYLSHVAIDRVCNEPTSDDGNVVNNEVIEIEGSLGRQETDSNVLEESFAANGKEFVKGPIISSDWEAAMSSVAEIPAAIVFVCGGKNTGKSTFARYLLNSLLNRYSKVGFLDTDVGQPELTPSGCVSLHVLDKPIVGLPALEMKDPERCYFFGDTSPKSNPEDYLKSVFSLSDHFKNKYILNNLEGESNVLEEGKFPLVINTHGWIQGVGFDVLIKIIDHVSPTHIVQILSKNPSRNLPLNRFWDSSTTDPYNSQLLYINNALGERTHLAEIKFDARELRDLRLVSYFQKNIKDKLMPTSRLSSLFEIAATGLACLKPFQVPISAIKVVHQHFKVPPCESAYSLNAALVGLGVDDQKSQEFKPRCVGLGIVRAVDFSKGFFYVITPLKLEALQQVNTFFQGRMEIPVSLLKAPGYISPYLCNNTISIEGTGAAVMGKGKKKALPMLRSLPMRTRLDKGA